MCLFLNYDNMLGFGGILWHKAHWNGQQQAHQWPIWKENASRYIQLFKEREPISLLFAAVKKNQKGKGYFK